MSFQQHLCSNFKHFGFEFQARKGANLRVGISFEVNIRLPFHFHTRTAFLQKWEPNNIINFKIADIIKAEWRRNLKAFFESYRIVVFSMVCNQRGENWTCSLSFQLTMCWKMFVSWSMSTIGYHRAWGNSLPYHMECAPALGGVWHKNSGNGRSFLKKNCGVGSNVC